MYFSGARVARSNAFLVLRRRLGVDPVAAMDQDQVAVPTTAGSGSQ
jgi:hypothetical protein